MPVQLTIASNSSFYFIFCIARHLGLFQLYNIIESFLPFFCCSASELFIIVVDSWCCLFVCVSCGVCVCIIPLNIYIVFDHHFVVRINIMNIYGNYYHINVLIINGNNHLLLVLLLAKYYLALALLSANRIIIMNNNWHHPSSIQISPWVYSPMVFFCVLVFIFYFFFCSTKRMDGCATKNDMCMHDELIIIRLSFCVCVCVRW